MTDRELVLEHGIRRAPCQSPEEARRLVAFACDCVRGTPVVGGPSLVGLLELVPTLRQTLTLVEDWLRKDADDERLRGAYEVVMETHRAMGPCPPQMTGPAAALCSVVNLYLAAVAAAGAESDENELSEVAVNADIAAYHARRSSQEGVTLPAIEFQEQLLRRHFGDQAGG
jgi:hypothetical protein